MTVQYRDGIEIRCADGTRVVCDADDPPAADAADAIPLVSHAHGDHYPEGEAAAVCSALTAAIATARREDPLHRVTDDRIELLPAGHVAGSRAAVVTDPDGTRYCYTGDVCTRSRFYLEGFDPPDADVLIVESTYGEPGYVFPEHDAVAGEVVDWLEDTEGPVLLFGYALGRAQKLELLAREAGRAVYATEAVRRVDDAVEGHLDVAFPAEPYTEETGLGDGDALVLPMTTARIGWIDRLAESTGASKAGFSGWAVDASFKYRGDYDVTFPLSDHCDFEELLELVAAVDPEQVYTTHGSTDTFASELTARGYDATALRQHQTALGDF